MNSNRRVILYIAMSLDGYIAGCDDDLSFLSIVEQEGEDYGYAEFREAIFMMHHVKYWPGWVICMWVNLMGRKRCAVEVAWEI